MNPIKKIRWFTTWVSNSSVVRSITLLRKDILRPARKLRLYMLYFTMQLISCMDLIKYIFQKPTLTRKIFHWQMLFEFDIVFVVQKAIKGQAIADFWADLPLNDLDFSESLFQDEDVLAIKLEPSNMELWHWKLLGTYLCNWLIFWQNVLYL